MMKFTILAVAVIAFSVPTTGGAQTKDDATQALIGRWEGQRATEGRLDNVAIVVTKADKGLAGAVYLNGQVFDAMTNIAVTGQKVTFAVSNMDFTAVIDGKKMTLTAHFENRELWTMTLAKKDKYALLPENAGGDN